MFWSSTAKQQLEQAERSLLPDRFFDYGWARKGFVDGMTNDGNGKPPTNPADRAEWQRGEDTALLVFVLDLLIGHVPPPGGGPGGPGGRGGALAPAGGGRVPADALPRPPVPHPLVPPPLEARRSPSPAAPPTPAPAAGAAPPPPPPPKSDAERRAELARKPSAPTTPPRGANLETSTEADARNRAENEQFKASGREKQNITGRVEEHHVASDKAHQNDDAQASLRILANADLSPQDKRNLVSVEDHGGRHGDFYHKVVRNRLEKATAGKEPHTKEYQDAVREALSNLKRDILRDGSPLNSATKKTSAGGSR